MALRLLSTVSVLCLLAISADAAAPSSPRVEVGVKGGADRSLLTTEFWAPLAQKSDRVLYGDIRLMDDNEENREGNLGLGYRQIHDNVVLGVHGWIDRRRTQNNSTFHQVTFGVERLGHVVDARSNVYVPLNQSRNIITPNIGQASPYLAGTGIFYDTNGILQETPQYGVDGEVGYRLPVLQKQVDAIRVYGGGYHFFRDETHDVTGFRVRTEAQINSAFSVGVRFQHDDPRGSQGFLEATIKFPFGAKKLYQTDYLRARLDESPERDVDIVTAARQIDTGLGKQVINTTSGEIQRVLHVDNSNTRTGDGSKENPFNTLKAAEAALKDNDILYVNHGTGTTTGMDQGIVIDKANVQMVGSGSALTYGGITLLDAGLAPVITNTDAYVDDGILGLTSYTGNGIFVTGRNITISGINVNDASASGIYVLSEGNGTDLGNVHIQNVTASDNINDRGIVVFARNYGIIGDVTLENITAERNNQHGVQVTARTDGVIGNTFLKNITANNSTLNSGIGLFATLNGTMGSAIVTNVIANGNGSNGLAVQSTNGIVGDTLITNVTANENTQRGVYLSATNGVFGNTMITNVTVNKNVRQGIYLYANSSIIGNATLESITATENTSYGLLLYGVSTGNLIVNILHSTIAANKQSGIFINDDTTGTLSVNLGDGSPGSGGNSIFGNNTSGTATHGDLRLDLDGGTMTAQGNWWGQAGGPIAGQIVNEGVCPGNCGAADTSNWLEVDPNI
ncbi:inverse autotransporter beta domain-containing protein [Sphingobacterium siyangense]|uniref:inverse autotransporter beta domain-containing protein n=1 Tax=Sphingobacterium siyangense TaxID=459529 RepID=UPI003DA31C3A